MNGRREEASIRQATSADHRELIRLRWDHKAEDGEIPAEATFGQFTAAYREQLASPQRTRDTVHWIAEIGGSAFGAVTVRIVDKEISPGKPQTRWGYLTNVYVEPSRRNRGTGTALLDATIAWAREQRLELLIVWPSVPSVSLYHRAGFAGTVAPLELLLED